jgi:hypothetical protein
VEAWGWERGKGRGSQDQGLGLWDHHITTIGCWWPGVDHVSTNVRLGLGQPCDQ